MHIGTKDTETMEREQSFYRRVVTNKGNVIGVPTGTRQTGQAVIIVSVQEQTRILVRLLEKSDKVLRVARRKVARLGIVLTIIDTIMVCLVLIFTTQILGSSQAHQGSNIL